MNPKIILSILFAFTLFGCEQIPKKNLKIIDFDFTNKYKNVGFALIYNNKLKDIKK